MHKARIGNEIEFGYLDSGAPENSNSYQTLIAIHGHTFHAQHFARILALASKYNLRIIALNRRDYVGSTLFTPAELEDLLSDDDKRHKLFLQARGLELAKFLIWVIDELKVPPKTTSTVNGETRTTGGLSVMGWSLGNILAISFPGHLKTYSRDIIGRLQPYLTTVFIYECHYALFGYPHPDGYYHPLHGQEFIEGLMDTWLSSYFTHPYYALPPSEQRESRTLSTLQMRVPESHTIRPTNERIPQDELLESRDSAPSERSEHVFFETVKLGTVYDIFRNAILLTEDIGKSAVPQDPLPDIKIISMFGTRSMWAIQWGAWQNEADLLGWKSAGLHTRQYEIVQVDGANHFLHYDDPERFLKIVVEKLLT